MIYIATILFLITAFFGLLNLIAVLRDRATSRPVVLMHGMGALFAILALIAYTVSHFDMLLMSSIIMFILAACGGLFLLTIDMSHKPIPKKIALMHPVAALAGLVLLFMYLYQKMNVV